MTSIPPQRLGLVYTTVDTHEKAQTLAQQAVEDKVAFCVNLFPKGLSIYKEGKTVQQAEEYYLIFKTYVDNLNLLKQWLEQHHPYEVPAILMWETNTTKAFYDYWS